MRTIDQASCEHLYCYDRRGQSRRPPLLVTSNHIELHDVQRATTEVRSDQAGEHTVGIVRLPKSN